MAEHFLCPKRAYSLTHNRLALNFKRAHCGLQYETSWVELTQVAAVRKTLGAAPVRKHDVDGSDFYTLPILVDRSTGRTVGDSFDIAAYLDDAYPAAAAVSSSSSSSSLPLPPPPPPLFPPHTTALHRALNAHVDRLFTEHVVLALGGMPLDPATEARSRAEFCRRAGRASWDEMHVRGEERRALLGSFAAALGGLAALWVKRDEGPFLEGAVPMYADLIVGGWLFMMATCLPEWELMRQWHGGLWGTLYDALGKYGDCD